MYVANQTTSFSQTGIPALPISIIIILLSDAFHKNISKAAIRAQSQLDVEKPHRVEDILNK